MKSINAFTSSRQGMRKTAQRRLTKNKPRSMIHTGEDSPFGIRQSRERSGSSPKVSKAYQKFVRKFRNVFSQAIRKSRNFLLDRSNTKVYLENEQNLENLQKKDTAKAFTKAAVKDKSNILVKGLMNRIDRALMKLSRQNVKKNHEEGKVPMANSQSSADSGSSPAPLVAPSSSHGYRDRFEWRDPQSNYTTISSPAAERKRLEIQKKRFSLIKESHNSGESFGSEEADLSMSASQTTHLNRRPLSSINEYAESTLNFLKHGKSTSSNEGAESHHVESRSRLNRLSIVVTKEVIIEETIRDDPN